LIQKNLRQYEHHRFTSQIAESEGCLINTEDTAALKEDLLNNLRICKRKKFAAEDVKHCFAGLSEKKLNAVLKAIDEHVIMNNAILNRKLIRKKMFSITNN